MAKGSTAAAMAAGNGNGHGNSINSRLDRLLMYHEEQAAHLRAVIALLREDVITTKLGKMPASSTPGGALAQAIVMDAERRERLFMNGDGPSPHSVEALTARRTRTAEMLATFDREEPRMPEQGRRVGGLVLSGYLKRKGAGYVRTAKPFSIAIYTPVDRKPKIDRSRATGYGTRANSVKRREGTARLLDRFDAKIPRPGVQLEDGTRPSFGLLVHQGYLRRKGKKGYIRTAKPFVINPYVTDAHP